MQMYEKASTKTTNSLSILNIGQDVIISLGLVDLMILSVNAVHQNNNDRRRFNYGEYLPVPVINSAFNARLCL
ncbi:hypothetical protein KNCP2_12340 [Candidatus Rickettsia kedanie]|uniref:Uncharacterized protein n=1 Tax=Candidatus Rickettsia kedanie TaxID=3115352 RepID=A0ABP9TUL2_9RICK